MGFEPSNLTQIVGAVLLFCLIFGMSATVDVQALRYQIKNSRAIMTGLILQYVILPVIGFLVVRFLNLEFPTGVTLLVISSSPGGSYSNWWSSMFNADLALSVTMTSVSSVLSPFFLPLNLAIYARYSYNDDILEDMDWSALIFALLIVITGIGAGLLASAYYRSPSFNVHANLLGNAVGVLLVLFSAVICTTHENSQVWNREPEFYIGCAIPCISGLLLANVITYALGLIPPERVTVSIECCYQNIGIATSIALGMFDGEQLAQAAAVPLYYGFIEAMALVVYCIAAWKAGWTKAPSDISFWKMIATPYEILSLEQHNAEQQAAKVVAAGGADNASGERVGKETDDGFYYVQHGDVEDPAAAMENAQAVKLENEGQSVKSGGVPA